MKTHLLWIELCSKTYQDWQIDSVKDFAVFVTAIITETSDYNYFGSAYFFRMCSVATILVTSLNYNPIRCATLLCRFRGTLNGYVATHFNLLSGTAESSATSGYVVIPERFDQNAEPASRNEERTKKKSGFVPSSGLLRWDM